MDEMTLGNGATMAMDVIDADPSDSFVVEEAEPFDLAEETSSLETP